MIRPERMHLQVDEPASGARPFRPRWSTWCSRARWSGSTCRALDGSALVAHVGPEDELPLLRPGDRVWAAWEPEAGRLLRRSERIAVDPALQEIEALNPVSPRSES